MRFNTRFFIIPLLSIGCLFTLPGCGSVDGDFFENLLDALLNGLSNGNGNGNQNTNNNQNGNNNDDSAHVLFFVHGAVFDGIEELNVTVDTIQLLDDGGDPAAIADLDDPARVNLINPDYSELLACFDDVPTGDYARMRLLVRNPELVLDDASVITSNNIDLTINGVIELVPGTSGIVIEPGENNVIEFDLADRNDSILVTDNNDGTVTLDSEVFYNVFNDLADPVLLGRGVVLDIDAQSGSSDVFYLTAASNCNLTVFIDEGTEFLDPDGDPIDPLDIAVNDVIGFEGSYDPANDVMTADVFQILE